MIAIELVCTETFQRRLVASGTDGNEVQRYEEDEFMASDRDVGFEGRDELRHSEQSKTQYINHGGDKDCGESAEVRICNEATKKRHQNRNSCPVVHILRCTGHILVEHFGEVYDQTRRQSVITQSFTELDR